MNRPKYKLVEVSTGNVATYGDDNTVVFGGPWGASDIDGNPLYVWQDNSPSAAELKSEQIDALTAQFQADDSELLQSWLAAYASGYIDSANEIAQEREQLLSTYLANVAAVQGGN